MAIAAAAAAWDIRREKTLFWQEHLDSSGTERKIYRLLQLYLTL